MTVRFAEMAAVLRAQAEHFFRQRYSVGCYGPQDPVSAA
jgi:hypothetical protein